MSGGGDYSMVDAQVGSCVLEIMATVNVEKHSVLHRRARTGSSSSNNRAGSMSPTLKANGGAWRAVSQGVPTASASSSAATGWPAAQVIQAVDGIDQLV